MPIHSYDTLNGLTHEEAYAKGYMDASGGDGRASRRAEEAHSTLDAILDRATSIAPWAYAEVYDGDADEA